MGGGRGDAIGHGRVQRTSGECMVFQFHISWVNSRTDNVSPYLIDGQFLESFW